MKRRSRTNRAGLHFSVSFIELLLKKKSSKRIKFCAPIFLSAVLEYLTLELMELAYLVACDNEKDKMTPRHLLLAIRNDESLDNLLSRVTIPEGGVLPNIQIDLLIKRTEDNLT